MANQRLVDSKTPRGKAAFHTLIPAVAFVLDAAVGGPAGRIIIGVTGAAVAVSVIAGARYSLFGRLFNQLIRPAFNVSPGRPEDAAPHRFAEAVGAICLLGAFGLFSVSEAAGWAVVLMVIALAAVNWLAGICVGCQIYLLASRVFGRTKATV